MCEITAIYLQGLLWPYSLLKYNASLLALKVILGMTAAAASTNKLKGF